DQRVVLAAHVFDDRFIKLIACNFDRGGLHDTAKRNDSHIGRTAADIDHHVAVRLGDVDARADRRRDRLLDQEHTLGARLRARVNDRALLDLGDDRGHTDDHIGLEQTEALHLTDKLLDHTLGHLIVRDDALTQRADGDNIARRTAEHFLCLRADGENFARNLVHRHYGWLIEYNALALDIDEHGRCAKINANIAGEQRKLSR